MTALVVATAAIVAVTIWYPRSVPTDAPDEKYPPAATSAPPVAPAPAVAPSAAPIAVSTPAPPPTTAVEVPTTAASETYTPNTCVAPGGWRGANDHRAVDDRHPAAECGSDHSIAPEDERHTFRQSVSRADVHRCAQAVGRHVATAFGDPRHRLDSGMRNLLRRSALVVLPVVAVSLLSAGTGSADPLNCVNGQFWDPITNTCQTPRPADNCAPGQYWNALSNVCRPLGQL